MTVTVECYGDSTIEGLTFNGSFGGPTPGHDGTVSSVVAEPAPAALWRLLAATYGDNVRVLNYGVSGATAEAWVNGIPGTSLPWAQQMAASPAEIVLICVGINDDPATIAGYYQQLVDGVIAAGKTPVVQTPNAINITWGSIDDKVAIIRGIGRSVGNLVDFNAETEAMSTAWYPLLSYSELFGSWSGLHPTQDGYELMAAAELPLLAELVGEKNERQ